MTEPKLIDYILVVEADPKDPTSDLLAVRREGGRMFAGEKPADAKDGEVWHGVQYTCIDRISRCGGAAGKCYMTTKIPGWAKLTAKQVRRNYFAEWVKPWGHPAVIG